MDMMLMEKYGWTPQQIDEIPKFKMDEMMTVLNTRIATEQEVEARPKSGEKDGVPLIGQQTKYRQQL